MQAGSLPTKAINVSRRTRPQHHRPDPIEADDAADVLAKIDSEHRYRHDPVLQIRCRSERNSPAVEGRAIP
jgi:hypothetical protein